MRLRADDRRPLELTDGPPPPGPAVSTQEQSNSGKVTDSNTKSVLRVGQPARAAAWSFCRPRRCSWERTPRVCASTLHAGWWVDPTGAVSGPAVTWEHRRDWVCGVGGQPWSLSTATRATARRWPCSSQPPLLWSGCSRRVSCRPDRPSRSCCGSSTSSRAMPANFPDVVPEPISPSQPPADDHRTLARRIYRHHASEARLTE